MFVQYAVEGLTSSWRDERRPTLPLAGRRARRTTPDPAVGGSASGRAKAPVEYIGLPGATDPKLRAMTRVSEKGEVLLRGVGVGPLRCSSILGENSASQVPICALAARRFDNPHQKVVPRSLDT